jgi:hypothetical protein
MLPGMPSFFVPTTALLRRFARTFDELFAELPPSRPRKPSRNGTQVEPDAVCVRDGSTYTSAGVRAGIDLALALVEDDYGPDLSREVAARSWSISSGPAASHSSRHLCRLPRRGHRHCGVSSAWSRVTRQPATLWPSWPST